jgi:hypothetical protein
VKVQTDHHLGNGTGRGSASVHLGTQEFPPPTSHAPAPPPAAPPPQPPPCRPGYRPRASPSRCSRCRTNPPPRRRSLSPPSNDAHPSCHRCQTTRAHTTRKFEGVAGRRQERERREDAVRRVSMLTGRCPRGLRVDRRRCRLRSRRGGGGNIIRTSLYPDSIRGIRGIDSIWGRYEWGAGLTGRQLQDRNVAHQP